MSGDEAPKDAAAASHPSHFGDNRGIRFHIKTGGKSYNCTLQDRGAYERQKAARVDSFESNTSSSAASQKSQ